LSPRAAFRGGQVRPDKRYIPYATLSQAFQTLVRQILVKSEAEVDQWRHTLREAVGPNGQLIVSLIPEVEFIIGKQPPVPDLPPQDAQNRFQLVFRRFICAFARPEHPLALFLDDLQWLDVATLDLLERLVTHPEVRHVLLVGAYRDNEVSPSHSLLRTLERSAKLERGPRDCAGASRARRCRCARLRCPTLRAGARAALSATGAREDRRKSILRDPILHGAREEGLLAFDSVTRAWQWDMNRIPRKSYTDNVVDLMVGEAKAIVEHDTRRTQRLACLGNVVEIATLSLVFGESEEEIHTLLLEAARTGLILRLEGSYAFLHDRIRRRPMPSSRRRAAGGTPSDWPSAGEHDGGPARRATVRCREPVQSGRRTVNRPDEKRQVATLDLRAGRKAKASAAYASAREYFSAGMALLDETYWGSQYELTFSLWLERAECEFLSGDFDKAEQLIMELLQRGTSKVDAAAAYHLKVQFAYREGGTRASR